MHCLICGGALENAVCPRCGYDLSLNRESYPTLGLDALRPDPLWVRRDALYQALLSGGGNAAAAFTASGLRAVPISEDECAVLGPDGERSGVLVIPDSLNGLTVRCVKSEAFVHADLTALTLPDSLKTVEEGAFAGCSVLASVTLPYGASLHRHAFTDCPKLANVVYPNTRDPDEPEGVIDPRAFDGVSPRLTIQALRGTNALRFAYRQCFCARTWE